MQTLQNPTLAALANAAAPYAVVVDDESFSPRYQVGQSVTIAPAVNADPERIMPRSVVLAIVATDPSQPRRFSRPALFALNADRDLIRTSTTISYGSYIVLGIALDEETVAPQQSKN